MALIILNVSQDGDDETVTNTLNSLIQSAEAIEGAAVEGFSVEPETWAASDSGKAFTESWNNRPQPSTTEKTPAPPVEGAPTPKDKNDSGPSTNKP